MKKFAALEEIQRKKAEKRSQVGFTLLVCNLIE